LLGEGINRLSGYQPVYGGIQVEAFLLDAVQLLQVLQETGPEQVGQIVQQLGYEVGQGEAAIAQTENTTLKFLTIQVNSEQ
jgi:hypothetical protein